MLKLPSLKILTDNATQSLRAFPLTLLAGVCTAILFSCITAWQDPFLFQKFFQIGCLTTLLGIPLLFAMENFGRSRADGKYKWLFSLLGVVLLAIYFVWECASYAPAVFQYRFIQLFLAAHLLVAISGVNPRKFPNAFWQFNRILFTGSATAFIFSAIFWLGCVIASYAVANLFDVKLTQTYYFALWGCCAFILNTWIVLGHAPKHTKDLETEEKFPKEILLLCRFVLVPLVVIYLAILYLYLGKILVTGEFPRGIISYMVSGVSALGITSVLLVYPLRAAKDQDWLRFFIRWFFAALIPMVSMLFYAIYLRVAEYGITEERYFLIVLGAWVLGISLGFILKPDFRISLIPTSLAIICLLSTFGPWSAKEVSLASQFRRLESYMKVAEAEKKAGKKPSFGLSGNISSIVRFLAERGDICSLQAFIKADISSECSAIVNNFRGDAGLGDNIPADLIQKMMAHLEIPYAMDEEYAQDIDGARSYVFYADDDSGQALEIANFQYYYRINRYRSDNYEFEAGNLKCKFTGLDESTVLQLKCNNKDLGHFDLVNLIPQAIQLSNSKTNSPLDLKKFSSDPKKLSGRLRSLRISVDKDEKIRLLNYDVEVLFNL